MQAVHSVSSMRANDNEVRGSRAGLRGDRDGDVLPECLDLEHLGIRTLKNHATGLSEGFLNTSESPTFGQLC
jgi:hypothetical protein